MSVIRVAAAADWPAVRALCADTGAQGDPVDATEREAFAERWIAPYGRLRPDWTFVAGDEGAIVGYLTGAPDTAAFEEERRRAFKPEPDAREFFPLEYRRQLWTRHPAHLHMNVAAAARGRGHGRALLGAFFAALRARGVPSAHLICGGGAAGYWLKAGFADARVEQPFPGVRLHAMVRAV